MAAGAPLRNHATCFQSSTFYLLKLIHPRFLRDVLLLTMMSSNRRSCIALMMWSCHYSRRMLRVLCMDSLGAHSSSTKFGSSMSMAETACSPKFCLRQPVVLTELHVVALLLLQHPEH